MSVVAKLIITGWVSTFILIGLCCLHQSGRLLRIHRRVGRWLEPPGTPATGAARRKPVSRPESNGVPFSTPCTQAVSRFTSKEEEIP